MQSAPRARRGQYASLPFDSHRFLAGGNGPGRRSGELFGSSRGRAGDNGASSFGDSSAATSNRGPKLLDADEASVRGWPVGCSCSALDCDDAVGTGHAHSLPWIGSRGRDSPSEMKTSVCSCRSRASLFACPSRVETETSLRSSRQRIYASDQDETRDVTLSRRVCGLWSSRLTSGSLARRLVCRVGALCGFTVSSEETRETSFKFIGAVGWSPPPRFRGLHSLLVTVHRRMCEDPSILISLGGPWSGRWTRLARAALRSTRRATPRRRRATACCERPPDARLPTLPDAHGRRAHLRVHARRINERREQSQQQHRAAVWCGQPGHRREFAPAVSASTSVYGMMLPRPSDRSTHLPEEHRLEYLIS